MTGYTDFATLLARFPELLMVRRFGRLTIQMLLYMQAELLYLEKDLDHLITLDTNNPDTAQIGQCWERMNQAFLNDKCKLQRKKHEEINDKLKTYHEYLLRIHQVQALGRPSKYNHAVLNDWLGREEGGNHFLDLYEAEPWTKLFQDDLVCLHSKNDRLDEWLMTSLTPFFHRVIGRRKKPDIEAPNIGRVWEYKTALFQAFGTFICIFMSFAVPLTSILGLYFVDDTRIRLALISVFTIAFSILVGALANSKRSDVFAATVAFAAVQVVFLQGINQLQKLN